jgi:endonuclease III
VRGLFGRRQQMKSGLERIQAIIARLRKKYPHSRTALTYRTPHQLLVATILSAQCTDKRVNLITPALFHKYRTIVAFAHARQRILEKEIHSAGFFRNKAKHIIAASRMIIKDYNGVVPDSMEQLVTLAGVSRKTANIVLTHAYHKAEGIAVDTHVQRLSFRMGLTREKDPVKIEQDLMSIVPKKDWLDINTLLVDYGREVCTARHPCCQECVVNELCPKKGVTILP